MKMERLQNRPLTALNRMLTRMTTIAAQAYQWWMAQSSRAAGGGFVSKVVWLNPHFISYPNLESLEKKNAESETP